MCDNISGNFSFMLSLMLICVNQSSSGLKNKTISFVFWSNQHFKAAEAAPSFVLSNRIV